MKSSGSDGVLESDKGITCVASKFDEGTLQMETAPRCRYEYRTSGLEIPREVSGYLDLDLTACQRLRNRLGMPLLISGHGFFLPD